MRTRAGLGLLIEIRTVPLNRFGGKHITKALERKLGPLFRVESPGAAPSGTLEQAVARDGVEYGQVVTFEDWEVVNADNKRLQAYE